MWVLRRTKAICLALEAQDAHSASGVMDSSASIEDIVRVLIVGHMDTYGLDSRVSESEYSLPSPGYHGSE